MKAVITGASSGIGRAMAVALHQRGAELWLVARREERLLELCRELGDGAHALALDLSREDDCRRLYESVKDEDIDILINNAGFGLFGEFTQTALERELEMLDINVRALHILTKLFLKDFVRRDKGYILNVASSAAFLSGPLMATYYATKAYVLRLSTAVSEELRRRGSHVYIGALCPGPVDTEFNATAGVKFGLRSLSAEAVAEYGIKKLFKKKTVAVPGVWIRPGVFFQRFLPQKLLLRIAYRLQRAKDKE